MGRGPPRATASRCRSRSSATPPRSSPPGRRPASGSTSSPTRPPPTTRSAATCRPRSRSTTPRALREHQPDEYVGALDGARWPTTSARCSRSSAAGAVVFDYGNNLRAQAQEAGRRERVRLPGLRAGVHPAAVLRGPRARSAGPRCRATRRTSLRTDRAILELFPDDAGAAPLDRDGRGARPVPGPAGPHLLAGLRRAREGRPGVQRAGRARARSRRRSSSGATTSTPGSVASPNRETEAMRDGSDAIADWPLLNALVNTAAGATWVSIHHGGGVGHRLQPARRHGRRRRRHGRSRRRSWSASSRRTRAWASCATSTRATSGRSRSPASAASASRCSTREAPGNAAPRHRDPRAGCRRPPAGPRRRRRSRRSRRRPARPRATPASTAAAS